MSGEEEEEEVSGIVRARTPPKPKKDYETDPEYLVLKQASTDLFSKDKDARFAFEHKGKEINAEFKKYLEECKKPNIGVWNDARDQLKLLGDQIGTIQSLIQKMLDNVYPGANPNLYHNVSEYTTFIETREFIDTFQKHNQEVRAKIDNYQQKITFIENKIEEYKKNTKTEEIEAEIRKLTRSREQLKESVQDERDQLSNKHNELFIKYLRIRISELEKRLTPFQEIIRNIEDTCYEKFKKEDTYSKLKKQLDLLEETSKNVSTEYRKKSSELAEYITYKTGGNSRKSNTRRKGRNTRRGNTRRGRNTRRSNKHTF